MAKKKLDAAGRTDSAATSDQMGQYGDERGAQSVSLSERRPGKEEDDDVDAMKVMNRCAGERPAANPFLGLDEILPTVYSPNIAPMTRISTVEK